MAEKQQKKGQRGPIQSPEIRVSYPCVFTPRTSEDGGKAKYSMQMLLPKSDTAGLKKLKDLLIDCAASMFGPDSSKWPNLRFPLRDGDKEKPNEEAYKGHWFFNASSVNKPGVVDYKVEHIMDPAEFYGGCYAYVRLTAFYYKNKQEGVSFGLRNIQKTRDGEALGSATKAEDDFSAIEQPDVDGKAGETAESGDPLNMGGGAAKSGGDPLGIGA